MDREDRHVGILICVGLLLCAVVVAFNVFYVPYVQWQTPQAASAADNTGIVSSSAVSGKTESGLVNINTANEEQLMTLPGIGQVLAQRIVQYRQQNGTFTSIEQLQQVQGIGEKTFATLQAYICV